MHESIIFYVIPNKQYSHSRFAEFLGSWINPKRATIICGDFNFDQREENILTRMLGDGNFKQIVLKPTTYRGYCIDHCYHNISETAKKIDTKLHFPYYSDHGAICVMIDDAEE